MLPYGRQAISQADIDAVVEVLQSDFLTQGPQVPKFEDRVKGYTGAQHAVAVNSATSALHVACLALGLGEGDWLWTSPNTFVASANCALYCGARVDFVDIDATTFTICPQALEAKLKIAERQGRLPKIVVPVHLCGQSCDMRAIHALSLEYGFKILEDASHAIGGRYAGQPVGSCQFSDITVFSFHPVKIITTAEGGMATTNDPKLVERLALFRSHGVTRDPSLMKNASPGPWYYEQIELGYNYRMTDVQAALGLSQMDLLDEFVTLRHGLRETYEQLLSDLPVTSQAALPDAHSALHLYVIRLDPKDCKAKHRDVFEALRANGIGVNLHYIPVHTQPYYRARGFAWGDFPEAEKYYAEAISLPMFPSMVGSDVRTVANALSSAVLCPA